MKTIGILWGGDVSDVSRFRDAFRQGLRDLGYVEGRDIAIEDRYAEGNAGRLPGLAAELVKLEVDVILASATPAAQAAKNATKTIPIVFAAVGDPVQSGFVASLARPGGNMTGVRLLEPESSGKRLQLLKETVGPSLKSVTVFMNPANPIHTAYVEETRRVAKTLEITLQSLKVPGPADFKSAFDKIPKEGAALIVLPDPMFNHHRQQIIKLAAAKDRLPAMYSQRGYVEEGGLMSYGASYPDMFRQAATYVDKILKGISPADIPIEGPILVETVINTKTAEKLHLHIPPAVRRRKRVPQRKRVRRRKR